MIQRTLRRLLHALLPLSLRQRLGRFLRHDLFHAYSRVYRSVFGELPQFHRMEVRPRHWQGRPASARLEIARHEAGLPPIPPALIGGGQGLYLLADGRLRRLVRGNFYGLTRRDGWWYVGQRLGSIAGRLFRFRLDEDGRIHAWELLYRDRLQGIHQIDFVGDRLYVTVANLNLVHQFDPDGRLISTHYPIGEAVDGRASPNYGHLNSVFGRDGRLYVVAMNITYLSGRRSQLLVCDPDTLAVQEIIEDIGNCAHDVLAHDGDLLTCNSMEGELRRGNRPVLTLDRYLRGLAVNDDTILLGRSRWVPDRRDRERPHPGWVYRLSRDFRVLETLTLHGIGQVQAIRFLGTDYGLSNTPR